MSFVKSSFQLFLGIFLLNALPGTVTAKPLKNLSTDTVPRANMDAIDRRLQEMDMALEKLNNQLSEKNMDKVKLQLEQALSQIDLSAVQQQVNEAMKKLDVNKMQLEASEALKKVDFEKLQKEIAEGMSQLKDNTQSKAFEQHYKDALKQAKQAMEQVKKTDFEKMSHEINRAKEQWQQQKANLDKQLQETRASISNSQATIQDQLENAKLQLARSKEQMIQYKTLTTKLETAGLLNANEDYTLDVKDGALYINGERQSKETSDKYLPYFGKEPVHIKKSGENFKVTNEGK